MTIHKEGYTPIALCILFIFVSNAFIQFYHPQATTLKWMFYIFSLVLFLAFIYFFRNPYVAIVPNEKMALSPADGKVIAIEEVEETEFLKTRAIRVSVAISPLDVHVNRNPVNGVVKYMKANRHTSIAVQNNAGTTILYRQTAGPLSKWFTPEVKEGDAVEQGKPFGFSLPGTRIDTFLPLGTKLNVDIDDVVKGGQTVLGQLKS